MAELNQLHVQFMDIESGRLDPKKNWLNLRNSAVVTVTIKEYQDELIIFEKEIENQRDRIKKKYTDQVARMQNQLNKDWERAMKAYNELREGKISKDVYDKLLEEYQNRSEIYGKQSKIQAKERDKTLNELDKQQEEGKQAISAKYENVRWISQIARDGLSNLTPESYYSRIEKGTVLKKYAFNDFLEGGGLIYIEPFFEGIQPRGKAPYGAFISIEGTTHDVVAVQWMTPDNQIITPDMEVAFGSTVFLNIYTQGLFGQNIEVGLKDQDYVLGYLSFWMKNGNDVLPAYEWQSPEEAGGEEPKIIIQEDHMTRSVDVYRIVNPTLPEKAKFGGLGVTTREKEPDKPEELALHVQKSSFEVYIDPHWEYDGGSNLEIFAVVGHKLLPTINRIKEMNRNKNYILRVNANGKKYENLSKNGNQVTSVSNIESNIAHFEHCKYTAITAQMDSDKRKDLFRQGKVNVDKKELLYEVVAKDTPNNLLIRLEQETTQDCNNEDSPEDHTGKVITLVREQKHTLLDNEVSLDIFYPKPDNLKIVDLASMAFMSRKEKEKYLKNYGLQFTTCRFQHDLDIMVYPDIEFTFNVNLGVDESEYLYVKQTEKYKKRFYKAKKKDGSQQAKKAQNKKRKEVYAADIDSKVTGNNFSEKYNISLGMEYKFGDQAPTEIELDSIVTLKEIVQTVLYICEVVDSYLSGSKMKDAENGEEFDADGKKKKISAAQKEENKKKFKKDEKKRKAKKKEFGKGFLPLRFEVSPPKFTGGVTWSYTPSTKQPYLVGTNFEFKLGAFPLLGFSGRLDLLFCAQFIPYLGQAIKAVDKAIEAVNRAGDVINFLGLGTLEAEYYFDLVVSSALQIDITKGATYHTIDGFTSGNVQIDSPLEIKLEAGGSVRYNVFDIKGEAGIHAEATAKFRIYYLAEKKKFLTFEFEGVEAVVKAKFKMEIDQKDQTMDELNPPEPDPDPITLLKGFSVDIPLFSAEYSPS